MRDRQPQSGGFRGNQGPPPRPAVPRPPEASNWPFDDYLKKGYFNDKDNLWPELVCGDKVEQMTRALGRAQGQTQLKAAQLRRFYGKAKNIELKLDSGQPFDAVQTEILSIQPLAANTVARGNALEDFKVFIDRNIALASKDEKHFRKGFLVHFQSVVALFPYLNGRR